MTSKVARPPGTEVTVHRLYPFGNKPDDLGLGPMLCPVCGQQIGATKSLSTQRLAIFIEHIIDHREAGA